MKPALLAGVAGVALVLALSGCSAKAAQPKPFDIHGTFEYGMGYATQAQFPSGSGCDFETPLKGTQVQVLNQSGTVVQTGTLGAGKASWSGTQGFCDFSLEVSKVPSKGKLFKLRITGYQDSQYYSKRDLQSVLWKGMSN